MRVNGPALTAIRERTGITKAELGRLTGIDLSVISRLESGERRGTEAQAKSIAAALQVPVTAVLMEVA